jgi:hypothetical protein
MIDPALIGIGIEFRETKLRGTSIIEPKKFEDECEFPCSQFCARLRAFPGF